MAKRRKITTVILMLILLIGFFLRIYKARELFIYGHDQDLAGWFVRDVVDNRHLRLIGQETSTQGIFIGPLYYYMLIPFYLTFGMDPIGGVVLITILGMFSIYSFYYVFREVFDEKTGLITALLYAISFYTVLNDREVVPTMPVIAWTVWFLYSLNLLMKGRLEKGYTLLGLLAGLIWHLNFALILVIPLAPLAHFLSGKKLNIKKTRRGVILFFVILAPFIIFELRHSFIQTNAFLRALTTDQQDIISGFDKFRRVIHLMSKNISGFLWGSISGTSYEISGFFVLVLYLIMIVKKKLSKNLALIFGIWIVLYVGFFSFYSKILSEYYLNGALVVIIGITAIFIRFLIEEKKLRIFGYLVILSFALINLNRYFAISVNKSWYLYRKAIAAEIKRDSEKRGFPCVSVSYITNPGYELGYRYFFYLYNLHVNRPDGGSPVYTIVFPLRNDIEVDKTFGALGLIYPDYSVYNIDEVRKSCVGDNQNITEPMWGLTI